MPRRRVKSQTKANVLLWLNNLLIKDGYYSNVSAGETDIYGRDVSSLISVSDASYSDNRVYQSAFKNWVHESGVTADYAIDAPLLASGVTVDGVFYPKDPLAPGYNASFGHKIDYVNGRIIFNSPIIPTTSIQAEFAYKSIYVDFADRFENEQDELAFETMYKDNPMQTGVLVYPSPHTIPLPSLMIDFSTRSQEAYELGSASNVALMQGSFISWTRDSADKDLLEDLIVQQEHTVLLGIDFNKAPMPLDSRNDKNPAFTNYDDFARLDSGVFFKRIYIDEISQRNSIPVYNIERSRLDFTIRVYPNF
jgi:hypothetical protein